MLDLDHPLTPHIFAASRAEDAILMAAKRMTLAASEEKLRLRDRCDDALRELRQIARKHFKDRDQIPPAIDALEAALDQLSQLPGNDGSPSAVAGNCPNCGTPIEPRRLFGLLRPKCNIRDCYCLQCFWLIMPSLEILQSFNVGFATDAI